ncbi:PREDICTED: uncharacterized protein LOC105565533 isoform X2 [Vollenhovia emeryi]|uniref:uncharacterized protein LOC105565533 isoform X2 n=1 Tax=Vollenhovia emeryi TaxID=411798 RepID=UPI0005F575C4|nr:PREDICTED: uncharacterized protein LOC105565533 isoform X2 [Vollenhovia emeryi]
MYLCITDECSFDSTVAASVSALTESPMRNKKSEQVPRPAKISRAWPVFRRGSTDGAERIIAPPTDALAPIATGDPLV